MKGTNLGDLLDVLVPSGKLVDVMRFSCGSEFRNTNDFKEEQRPGLKGYEPTDLSETWIERHECPEALRVLREEREKWMREMRAMPRDGS